MPGKRQKEPSLVEQLQAQALDRRVPIEDLLRRAKVVASKLDLKDFSRWVDNELKGYSLDAEVPSYRVVTGEICALNPYRGWQPVIWKNAQMRKRMSAQPDRQPIGQISNLVNRSEGGRILAMPLGSMKVNYGLDTSELVNVQLQVDGSQLVGILDAVRNQILEWSLKLEREGITGEGLSFSEREKKRAHKPAVISKINIKADHLTAGVVGSVSGRATVRANQTAFSMTINLEDARKLVEQVKRHLDDLELASEQRELFQGEVENIEGELVAKEVNQSRLRTSFAKLREMLMPVAANVAGNVIAAGILTALNHVLGLY